METLLNAEFCQKLVQAASLVINHNVLITDEQGVVVASDDTTRIGTFHEASLRVFRSKQMEYHGAAEASRLAGTLPGMTIPILVQEEPVGTIGITGLPEEISRYAKLMQQFSQIFLDFQTRQQAASRMDYRRQSLLREILSFHPLTQDAAVLQKNAYELGINLNLPRGAAVLHVAAREGQAKAVLSALAETFHRAQDLLYVQNETEYVVLAALEGKEAAQGLLERCQEAAERLGRQRFDIKVGVGSPADGVESLQHSYQDAKFALLVLERCRPPEERCLTIEQAALEKLAASLPERLREEAAEKWFKGIWHSRRRQETEQLLECWCRSRFHFARTAELLHIHKSTLTYRFQRIQALYGLDLYDVDQTMALYLLFLGKKLE